MDITDIIRAGASLFIGSDLSGVGGSSLDLEKLITALSKLTPNGIENAQGLDVSQIVDAMRSNGLDDLASTWLGNGQNGDISGEQVSSIFGSETISKFASILGLTDDEATGGLRAALPEIVDRSSSGGSLLGGRGCLGRIFWLVRKLF